MNCKDSHFGETCYEALQVIAYNLLPLGFDSGKPQRNIKLLK